MRGIFARGWMIVVAVVVLVGFAGCGGDDSDDNASPTTAAGAPAPGPSNPDASEFCDLIATYSDRLAVLGQPSATPERIRAVAEDGATAIQQAVAAAPADIKGDVTVVAGAAEDYLAALQNAGYDLSKLPPDAAGVFSAPDVSASASNLQVYAQNTCGLRGS